MLIFRSDDPNHHLSILSQDVVAIVSLSWCLLDILSVVRRRSRPVLSFPGLGALAVPLPSMGRRHAGSRGSDTQSNAQRLECTSQ